MRIIAGQHRGRTYAASKDPLVRPISGRIKQSLFDILRNLVPGARVLDLFAGTGAVGFEALSRGAVAAVFVDHSSRCLKEIEINAKKLGFSDKIRTQPGNVLEDLSWIPFRTGLQQFDIVFMGPPYKDRDRNPLSLTSPALARVAAAGFLAPGAWVVAQHHLKEPVEAPPGLTMARRERYGDTYLSFFRPAKIGD